MALIPLLLCLFAAVCLVWAVVGSSRVVTQVRFLPALTPADFSMPYEEVKLTAADGVAISAWLIRHAAPKGVIVMLHGYSASKADLLDIAQALFSFGAYHLLLLDGRAHGASGGRLISFGKEEWLDVRAAVDFLGSVPELKRFPIGCYGVSMGGAIGIQAAVRLHEIRALVTDSAYSDLSEVIAVSQRLKYHIPRFPLGQMAIWGIQVRLRVRMSAVSPDSMVGQVAPRPILLIHGEKDVRVSAKHAKRLYTRAREPKQIWLVPEAGHADAFYFRGEEYARRVLQFFDDGLRRET